MSEEKKDKTARDIIEEVCNEICNHYCKYPDIWDAEKDGELIPSASTVRSTGCKEGNNMIVTYRREISKEQYIKTMEHGGRLTEEQELEILGESIVRGYGVYGTAVYMDGDKYMLKYETNDSCD